MPRVHLILSGRVQGVGFRYHALRCAERLHLRGWVRNLPDGSVEVEAEGERDVLAAFAAEMRQGPSAARVLDCAETWHDEGGGRRDFRIIG
jgi:acylphosphatase